MVVGRHKTLSSLALTKCWGGSQPHSQHRAVTCNLEDTNIQDRPEWKAKGSAGLYESRKTFSDYQSQGQQPEI